MRKITIHYQIPVQDLNDGPSMVYVRHTGTLTGLTDQFVAGVRDAFRFDRNHCIECGQYTVYSPYACEKHASRNGGDEGSDE